MRRLVASLVVVSAVALPLACSKAKSSRAAFCRELRRTSGLEQVLSGYSTDEPSTIRRKMRDAARQFARLEQAAPREVRSDVAQVSNLVDKIVEAVDQSPADPQAIAKRLRPIAANNSGALLAGLRMTRYAADQCKLELNAPGGPRPVVTSAPPAPAPDASAPAASGPVTPVPSTSSSRPARPGGG